MHSLATWYRNASLHVKFALHSVLSTALLFAILLPLVLYIQKQALLSDVESSGFQLAEVFARSSVEAVVADDYLFMQHVVNGIASDTRVLSAMLLKEDGQVLVHNHPNERGKRYTDPTSLLAARARAPLLQRRQTPEGIHVYDFAVPVYVLAEQQASARVAVSVELELAEIARTRNYIILLGLGVLGLGLAWAGYQAKRVTQPVQTLVAGAQAVAKGNLDHRIPVTAGDELGHLALAFNRMTESVQALIETSQELSSALDQEVVLRSIAAYALTLVKADLALIAPLEMDAQEARVRVVLGARSDRLQNLLVTPSRGIGGRVLTTGEPYGTANYFEDPLIVHDPVYDQAVGEEGIVAALAVPITVKGHTIGLLWVANRSAKTFTREDADSLQRMANQAAIALENARLYEDIRRSHQELLAAQEELVQKTRMAAMGEIAAAVAHETRNPLGALSNCVQLLRMNAQLTGEDKELLEIVQAETQRLNEIVSDFLAFGRPRPPHFDEVDLNELLDETLAFLQRDDRCAPSVTAVRRFAPGLPKVRADRDQVRQVFWNLFLNAVQVMGEEGTLRIDTRRAGGEVEIVVRDTGPGIPATVLPRIFEPFYTTKAGGTGLGLSIVRRIVEEHGGRITVESHEGAGACFTVSIPVHSNATVRGAHGG